MLFITTILKETKKDKGKKNNKKQQMNLAFYLPNTENILKNLEN